jgi:hypothetical protein
VKGFALLFKNKNLSLPDFYNKFQQVVKIEKDSEIFLLPHLVYSQIWLNLLVDDPQFGYTTQLR